MGLKGGKGRDNQIIITASLPKKTTSSLNQSLPSYAQSLTGTEDTAPAAQQLSKSRLVAAGQQLQPGGQVLRAHWLFRQPCQQGRGGR